MEADFIVVGAGAAGCAVAGRLLHLGLGSVLVVEAGGNDHDPRLHVPMAFHLALQHPRLTHRYEVGSPRTGGESETWVRGRVMGGSTAINGMMYARGEPEDYDELAAAGNPGWSWELMHPIFLAMEENQPEQQRSNRPQGRLPVTIAPAVGAVPQAVLQAAQALGIQPVGDIHTAAGERIGSTPSTIRHGRRVSAARAFLPDANTRDLRVLTGAMVDRLLFDGHRVVGVRMQRGRSVVEVRARREVLLAAGTIESPLILERSGIGRPDVLERAGVEVRIEHPNVGERVIEQRAVTVKARLREGLGHNPHLDTRAKRVVTTARYLARRNGVLARGPFDLLALIRALPEAARPDAQLMIASLSTDDTGLAVADHPGLMIQGYPLRPTTCGSVHISGPRPEDPPDIDARFLDTEDDVRITAGILRRSRELLATDPLRGLIVEELAPGPDVASADEVVRYARQTGTGIYHAVGSCSMGSGDNDVVDPSLCVRGTTGLRVVDAAVLPRMLSGGTAAPTMAVAWRAADIIAAS